MFQKRVQKVFYFCPFSPFVHGYCTKSQNIVSYLAKFPLSMDFYSKDYATLHGVISAISLPENHAKIYLFRAASFSGRTSEIRIAAKTNTKPRKIWPVRISAPKATLNATPNGDSRESNKLALAGGTFA